MRLIRVIVLTAAMVLLVAGFGEASIPSPAGLIHACYSPVTGVVRLVDSDNPACGPAQTAITWPATIPVPSDLVCDGCVHAMDIADGAVRTSDIFDAAVTSPKIQDGGVGVIDLAFDPATQPELDAFRQELQTSGTINSVGNPVNWTKLRGVPAGFADGVDSDSSDAMTLDGLDSAQFLRSDASDTYTSGTLTMHFSSDLNVDGDFRVGSFSSVNNDLIYFDNGSSEEFGWMEGVGNPPDGNFWLSDQLRTAGSLLVGCEGGLPVPYNRFRESCFGNADESPSSGDVDNSGDLFTQWDLEVGGAGYLSKSLYMEGSNSPGADGNQSIFFYDNDSRSGRSLMWNDTSGTFRFNDSLGLDASQSQVGTGGEALYLDYNGPDGNQQICFYDDNLPCGQSLRWDNGNSNFILNDVLAVSMGGTATTNGLCHSGTDLDGGSGEFREIVVCSTVPGDVAEWYETTGVSAGEIVVPTARTVGFDSDRVDPRTGIVLPEKDHLTASVLTRSGQPYQDGILGVVSTSPVQTIGRAILSVAKSPAPVAISGRVPVKVTAAGGAIRPGDPLTASAMPGAGMKATQPGMIVGYALDHYSGDGVGSILVMVRPGWHGGTADAARVEDLESRLATLESLVARLADSASPGLRADIASALRRVPIE